MVVFLQPSAELLTGVLGLSISKHVKPCLAQMLVTCFLLTQVHDLLAKCQLMQHIKGVLLPVELNSSGLSSDVELSALPELLFLLWQCNELLLTTPFLLPAEFNSSGDWNPGPELPQDS